MDLYKLTNKDIDTWSVCFTYKGALVTLRLDSITNMYYMRVHTGNIDTSNFLWIHPNYQKIAKDLGGDINCYWPEFPTISEQFLYILLLRTDIDN